MTLAVDSSPHTLREQTVEAVKQHKASWIRLGQLLYTIHKDKLFKTWGFQTFEGYCRKELHIKQATASKLLKSYNFIEREEPQLASATVVDEETPQTVPDYESVNLLRLAKQNKELTPQDIAEVRESVIEKAREPKEVRAQVKRMIDAKDTTPPEEQKRMKRNAVIKRVVSVLSNVKKEFEKDRLLPDYLLKQMGDLVEKLEDQVE